MLVVLNQVGGRGWRGEGRGGEECGGVRGVTENRVVCWERERDVGPPC